MRELKIIDVSPKGFGAYESPYYDEWYFSGNEDLSEFEISEFDPFGTETAIHIKEEFKEDIFRQLREAVIKERERNPDWQNEKYTADMENKEKIMMKENQVDKNGVSLDEYQAWQRSKEVKSIPDPSNANVAKANSISIVDYAKKNGLSIINETQNKAVIEDPATKGKIIVNKISNSWSGQDLDGKDEHGKMIRFYMKTNRIYPESNEEYKQHINSLAKKKDLYQTSKEYNREYKKSVAKIPKTLKQKEKKEEHAETILANQISIMDFAYKHGYAVNYEDAEIARIQDVITENEITVYKENNTWSVKEKGKIYGGRTIRFVARMQEMNEIAAMDNLLENRKDYLSKEEYNQEYEKKNTPVKEEVSEEKEVPQTKSNAKEKKPELLQNEEAEVVIKKKHYSKDQLAEIIAGSKKGLNVKVYDNIELSAKQMRELRLGLEKGINISKFASKNVPAEYMREVRLAAQEGLDTKVFHLKKKECVFSAEQAKEIRLGLKELSAEQLKVYLKKDLSADVMHELRLGMRDGLDMQSYNTGVYTAKDIHTIRMHMMVKQFIEILKERLSNMYEQLFTSIKEYFHKENPNMTQEELEQETELHIRDEVKEIYENIEEAISEKSIEEKKEILVKVFDKIIAMGNALETIYPEEEKAVLHDKTVESFVENRVEQELKVSALESLKEEYREKFSQYEQEYNVKLAEFIQQIAEEPSLTVVQKQELLYETFGNEFGEKALESLMEHLPEPSYQEVENVQEQIMEYMEDFEFEMEL